MRIIIKKKKKRGKNPLASDKWRSPFTTTRFFVLTHGLCKHPRARVCTSFYAFVVVVVVVVGVDSLLQAAGSEKKASYGYYDTSGTPCWWGCSEYIYRWPRRHTLINLLTQMDEIFSHPRAFTILFICITILGISRVYLYIALSTNCHIHRQVSGMEVKSVHMI